MDKYDFISPSDFRYFVPELQDYLSENAFVKYKAKVELALLKAFEKNGLFKGYAEKLENIIPKISAKEVYEEEKKTKHDIRALVNVLKIKLQVSEEYLHLGATSYDIIDTANILRYREATKNVIIPKMISLEKVMIELAKRECNTIQIGRTHGQHAVPITFGFTIANYVNRFGERILQVEKSCNELKGKISGAVGAYNSFKLLFENPEMLEYDVLKELDLEPERISTQIVPGDAKCDFLHSIISAFSVIANIADDMRNLQRTELHEIYELKGEEQVGSSTMPQKSNPVTFENIKSLYKAYFPRMITIYLDQISEHQRDLTNSASQRYICELLNAFTYATEKMKITMKNIKVNKESMSSKINDYVLAEALYILLGKYKCPNAYEHVRKLVQEAQNTRKQFSSVFWNDNIVKKYSEKFKDKEIAILKNPELYVGIAEEKTLKICKYWENVFGS